MKILNDTSIVNNLTVTEDVSARDVFLTDNNLYIGNLYNDLQHNGVPEVEKSKWTLSYSATTRVFTITISADTYYYVNGKRFALTTGAHNWTAHTLANGLYFFYFDTSGNKITSTTAWDLLNTVQVAVVKYNSANDGGAAAGILTYELHGMVMSPAVHKYEHLTEGTRLITGGGISGFTLDTSTLAAVTWGLSTSTIADEDIFTTVAAQPESNYLLGYFDAGLNFNWRLSTNLPFFTDGTNIQYNQIGVGLTALSVNNTFVNYYVILMNANTPSEGTIVIPGQTIYNTLGEAQQESPSNLNLGNLPFQESVFLYQITMKWIAAGSTTVGKAVIAANPARQNNTKNTIVSAASDHNLLSNRNVLGAHLAGAIQTDDSLFSGILTPAFDISVQQSLQSLSTRAVDKNMFTAAGDIVYASGVNTPVRLGKGTDGQVLKLVSGLPSWQADNNTIYTHPANHPPSIITQDSSNRFVTDTEKTNWNNPYEANLRWGGKNFTGTYGCIDAAMIGNLGANRFAFLKAPGITIEYSRDNGSTWLDYGATDIQKVALFSGLNASFVIGKADATDKATADYKLRVTVNTSVAQLYTTLNKFSIFMSTNGSTGTTCTIDAALESTPTTFVTIADSIPITGWSGYNIINISGITTYGNTPASQYGRLRFNFNATGGSDIYYGMQIISIYGFGGVGWQTPSNMARNGHLYTWDGDQKAIFPAIIQGTQLQSAIATGTAPLIVASTTVVPNLNASTVTGFTVGKSVPSNALFTDTIYTHPANHPPSIITQDTNNRFVTDAEKLVWDSKASQEFTIAMAIALG